jgi:TonB family protein
MNLEDDPRLTPSLSNRALFSVLIVVFSGLGPAAVSLLAADENIIPPRMTRPVQPEYPSALRDAGVEGQVDVVFEVDRRGSVRDASIQYATHKEFGEAVKLVVQRWRFDPATENGRPVDLRVRMPVVFVIKETDPLSKWAGRNVFKTMDATGVLDADDLGAWPEPAAWIEPYYPPQLNGSGKRGEIVVSFIVDQHGDVVNPEILVGDDPHFIASALAATVSLEFSPHLNEEGDAIPVSMAVSYKFDEKKQQQWDKAVVGKKKS